MRRADQIVPQFVRPDERSGHSRRLVSPTGIRPGDSKWRSV